MGAPTAKQIVTALAAKGVSVAAGNLVLVKGYDDPSIAAHQGTWAPAYVVMHDTGTGIPADKLQPAQSLGWMVHDEFFPVRGCHFLIGRDGKVYFVYAYACYHAGLGGPYGPSFGTPGDTDVVSDVMNTHAYGIEHESSGLTWDLTSVQVDAGARVAAALVTVMGKHVENVLNHKDWTDVTQRDGVTRTGRYKGRKVDTRQPREWWWQMVDRHLLADRKVTIVVGGKQPMTAARIAESLGVSVPRLLRFNPRLAVRRARPGDAVRIPPGVAPVRLAIGAARHSKP